MPRGMDAVPLISTFVLHIHLLYIKFIISKLSLRILSCYSIMHLHCLRSFFPCTSCCHLLISLLYASSVSGWPLSQSSTRLSVTRCAGAQWNWTHLTAQLSVCSVKLLHRLNCMMYWPCHWPFVSGSVALLSALSAWTILHGSFGTGMLHFLQSCSIQLPAHPGSTVLKLF